MYRQQDAKHCYEAKPKLIDKAGKNINDFGHLFRSWVHKSKCSEIVIDCCKRAASLDPVILNSTKQVDKLNLITTNLFVQYDAIQRNLEKLATINGNFQKVMAQIEK